MPRRRKRVYKFNPLWFLGGSVVISFFILSSAHQNSDIKNVYADILATSTVRGTVFGNILDRITDNDKDKPDYNEGFSQLLKKVKTKNGTYGIYIKDLQSGKDYVYKENEVFYAASLYKTPIAITALKQIQDEKLTYETPITYMGYDSSGGTGSIQSSKVGTVYTIDELIKLLMKESDNVAQNMLIRILGQKDIKQTFEKMTGKKETQYYHVNDSSAKEIATTFELFLESNFINDENKKYLFDVMSNTIFDDRIANHLEPELIFAHKIGSWGTTGSWHDCGIVYTLDHRTELTVCMMSKNASYEQVLETGKDIAEFVNMWN